MNKRGVDKLRRKLKGRLYVSRDRHLQAVRLKLSDSEFRLLELYRDLTDWDKKHTETLRTFDVVSSDIALFLGCHPSKVSRTRKILLKKGLITENEDGSFKVIGYQRNEVTEEIPAVFSNAKQEDTIATVQQAIALTHKQIAPAQQDRGYNSQTPLVSFKGNSVSLVPCDKYLELEKSGRFGNFNAEDMEFVEPSSREWELVRQRMLAR